MISNHVAGERIIRTVIAHRKGKRGTVNQSEFDLQVGYLVDNDGNPTGQIRIRARQKDTGVAPVVGTLDLGAADDFCTGLIDSISFAEQAKKSAA